MSADTSSDRTGGYRASVDQDTGEPASDAPGPGTRSPAWYQRPELALLAVAAVVVLALGYGIGYSRGSAGLDSSSPTTSLVDGPAPTSTSATTETTIDIATVVPLALPTVPRTTEGFDRAVPKTIVRHPVTTPNGPWAVQNGSVAPSSPRPLPDDATDARLAGAGPELFVELDRAPVLALVTLSEPTAFSGLVFRSVDDANYWALVPDARLANLTVYEVKDGRQTAVGFVEQQVTPGLSIGLVDVDGQIGVVVNGATVALRTFYGPKAGLPDDGIAGKRIGLITGQGAPRFDDLTFG